MSGEMMNFPDTAEEFMEQYKIVDSEEVYTNGAELVPIFRMKQWFEQHPEPHWIPVTERLPEDDTVVLVCGKSGGIYTAIHNNSKTWIRGWWKMNSKNHHCNPIAWMPLPEPYKGVTT